MSTQLERSHAHVARALRDGIIEHYRDRGEDIDTPAGRRTLDTNTTLSTQRAALLVRLLARRGVTGVDGLRVVDLGCGFGSLSLHFACAGAEVVGVDPNAERSAVAAGVAASMGLPASFRRGWLEDLTLADADFDVAILNNSLCYVVGRRDRRRALQQTLRVLRPGGWALLRNPARMAPLDPFTRLPLVHQLPPRVTARLLRNRSSPRSAVRLKTGGGASRELRRAGFTPARVELVDQRWWLPPRYQHHTAQRPR